MAPRDISTGSGKSKTVRRMTQEELLELMQWFQWSRNWIWTSQGNKSPGMPTKVNSANITPT